MKKRKAPARFSSDYTGDLNNPINIWGLNHFGPPPVGLSRALLHKVADRLQAQNDAHLLAETGRKMKLLIKHFHLEGIDPPAVFAALAYRLALAHVPGFGVETSNRKTSEQRLLIIEAWVHLIKERGQAKSDLRACVEVAKILHKRQEEAAGKKNPRQLTDNDALTRGRRLRNLLIDARKL